MSDMSNAEPMDTTTDADAEAERRRIEAEDKPIEHDPIGQALVSLPFALGEGAVEGVSVGATLVKEGIASGIEWVGDELFGDSDAGDASGSADDTYGAGAGSEATPSDAGVGADDEE